MMLAFNEVAKLDRVMYDILDAMTDVSDLTTLPAVRWHLHSAVSLPASLSTVSLPASLCLALLHLVMQLRAGRAALIVLTSCSHVSRPALTGLIVLRQTCCSNASSSCPHFVLQITLAFV